MLSDTCEYLGRGIYLDVQQIRGSNKLRARLKITPPQQFCGNNSNEHKITSRYWQTNSGQPRKHPRKRKIYVKNTYLHNRLADRALVNNLGIRARRKRATHRRRVGIHRIGAGHVAGLGDWTLSCVYKQNQVFAFETSDNKMEAWNSNGRIRIRTPITQAKLQTCRLEKIVVKYSFWVWSLFS